MKLEEIIKGKRVLFITTKNIDYIRNTQEIKLLKQHAKSYELIYSEHKNYILRIVDVWKKIRKKSVERNEVMFLGFAPQLIIPFLGYKFKEKLVIIDFFISMYDTLVYDRKKFRKGGMIAKILHRWDECTLKKGIHVITDTKEHAEYFISEFKVSREKCETLYLEADSTIYFPRPQDKTKELNDKFVVIYFGSILPLQGVEVILDVIKKNKDNEDIYFEIIGPIPSKFSKPMQKNVQYIEWLSQEELAIHIANADLCLAGHFSGDIDKARRTIPGKAYIYEAMGKRMILGENCANHELFLPDEKHIFVDMGDATKLSEIIQAKQNEQKRNGEK